MSVRCKSTEQLDSFMVNTFLITSEVGIQHKEVMFELCIPEFVLNSYILSKKSQ
jgi:flagellar motor switch protein FliM